MLSRSPFIDVVGIARNGAEALELVEELKPDVVTCDLNMPVLDGVGFVSAQMARRPLPIIIISIAAGAGAQLTPAVVPIAFVPTRPSADPQVGVVREGDECFAEYRQCVDRIAERGYARFPG